MKERHHRMRGLVSIHDVMPETLGRVDRLADYVQHAGGPRPTLLVVPGKPWDETGIDWLRAKAAAGFPMAGHGWAHEAPPPGGVFHVVHGAVISANQAEHLSRSREEVRSIVLRCHEWFARNRLPPPDTYVPPAWALGALTRDDLEALPFRRYETLTGFIDAGTGRRIRVPLVGFEAANRRVAWELGASNRLNLALARMLDRPVRVCLHPADLELRLAKSLVAVLERPWSWVEEAGSLFDPAPGPLSPSTIRRRGDG